ncbi:uncharacterized protein HMPREF1541_03876 [Cyphellophora europaea CBS 101466]|uniref:Calcium channel YVC1-like C-terminal transmembrane domain-containing protein n=1 Tax=Cyphellophora europaea (strain CBS 101466) TaxID=1220924 RepID=W2RZU0_CYPE1|nr:uncharacterized protein HMPREF1541_03876 [Cyphellophora europaea CBS 101466]ETN41937.1 hypothetical protein HMPREF1541_03876 [Cyphellophora europaea CBS 101466]
MPPATPRSTVFVRDLTDDVPVIDSTEGFTDVVDKLITYLCKAIDAAYTYDQLRTSFAGQSLRPLIASLSDECHHPAIVAALLACRYQFRLIESDGTGVNDSRALACEFVAWQFLTFLSERELMDYLLYELPEPKHENTESPETHMEPAHGRRPMAPSAAHDESAPLLHPRPTEHLGLAGPNRPSVGEPHGTGTENAQDRLKPDSDLSDSLAGMNALEIALVCDAKKFISSQPVQKVVTEVWNGDIVFWETMSVHAKKQPTIYKKRSTDPFIRLRVPRYQKTFQVMFFLLFLALYYIVLVARDPQHVNVSEILLYVWILAFAYDEFGEIQDAGLLFYRTDFWSLWDMAIIIIATAFFVTRIIGLLKHDAMLIDTAFDILSMVALFLVPRIFSIFSLNPYFGSLIPVLKEMTKAFCKFLPVIVVLYLGFLTTFSMLARDKISINEMSWILIKVFFGSSYLGFDVAVTISPLFGYTLMLIFVCLTNILLLTSLVSLVSNSLTEVMAHAREEYLFQYSIYVLESSTSGRLTYFVPPLNLIPLLFLRPLRLVLPSDDARRVRIVVLKATHAPLVALVWAFERSFQAWDRASSALAPKGPQPTMQPFVSPVGPDGVRGSTRSVPRPGSAKAAQQTSALQNTVAASPTNADNSELLALVQTLSTKVDDLAAMIAGQQPT